MSENKIPEEILKQFNDEFDIFANNQEARDFCFGNYNNSTRDEQVGRYCYVGAKTSSYERELKRDIQIRDCLKSIELSCVSADDERATELIESIEDLLSSSSKEQRYKILDELEKLQQRILELEKELVEKDELIEKIDEYKEVLVRCVTCDRLSEKFYADSFTAAGIVGGEVVERDDWECNHCAEKEELREQIAKRDEVINSLMEKLNSSEIWFEGCEEWLNQVQKLREGGRNE